MTSTSSPALTAPSRAEAMISPRDLVALTKPRLSALVIFTAAGGLLLAPASVPWPRAVGSLLGLALIVGAANTLNNYLERDSDRHMARTASRPLPAGRLPHTLALVQGLVLTAVAVPALTLLANPLTGLLGAIALITYVLVYTPLKRRSAWATLVGALPGALPPLMGWTTATGRLDAGGLLLFAVLFIWQIPHFLAIGLYRADDYAAAGLKVHANEIGAPATRRRIAAWLLLLLPVTLLLVPFGVGGVATGVAAAILSGKFLWEGLKGLRPDADAAWARRLFFFSLVHLTGLFAVLGVENLLR